MKSNMFIAEQKVLDKGFVGFVEGMGFDRGVVQAARVSYKSQGLSTPEKDKKLIGYLLTHKHGTPFEHAVLKFHIKAPLFVARQWFRHRMASYNEESGRYTVMKDEFYLPEKWRGQATDNKQGSAGVVAGIGDETGMIMSRSPAAHARACMDYYQELLDKGVAREMARMVLPVNVYTSWYWTVNARALMNFLELRSEAHAQFEIRQYSNAIWKIFAERMPWSAEAFLGTINIQKYAATEGIAGPCIDDVKVPA